MRRAFTDGGVDENAERFVTGADITLLNRFLDRYAAVEELPVKTEISRALAAVLRIIYADEPRQDLLTALLADARVEEALWDMVRQDKYPVVRSEGWFGLALLARSRPGAERVVVGLETEKELLRSVLEGTGMKDRDNVGVLVAEVKKNCGGDVAEELLRLFMEKLGIS